MLCHFWDNVMGLSDDVMALSDDFDGTFVWCDCTFRWCSGTFWRCLEHTFWLCDGAFGDGTELPAEVMAHFDYVIALSDDVMTHSGYIIVR
jgi:hypothetical protein